MTPDFGFFPSARSKISTQKPAKDDDATALQQKCYPNHHKAIRQAKALHPHQGEGFLNDLAAMLRGAVALQAQKAECDPEGFQALRQALERTGSRLLDSPRS